MKLPEQGVYVIPGKGCEFILWAPNCRNLQVEIDGYGLYEMDRQEGGYFQRFVEGVGEGVDYRYVPDDGDPLPDPASRRQPQGVHAPSRTFDPTAYSWRDDHWEGIPLDWMIFYELHIGTFTPEGTFDAAIGKIPHLVDLGITAVEIMPVASFPGERNWGYDGVYLYSVQESYGGPRGLQRFVNACHRAGLAVVLDVVYNHFGPEGNYLAKWGPYFTERYQTPWGPAINYDGEDSLPVRRFVIDNALYWRRHFHIDALRLDAVHAIFDEGPTHILADLSREFHVAAKRKGWVVAESDLNEAKVIQPREEGGYGVDAQWNDDFHHAFHTLLTGNLSGYFADFGKIEHLAKAIREGYVYQGQWSPFRQRRHGTSSTGRPGEQFVIFNQNHDQIANASHGKPIASLVSMEKLKTAAAILFFCPNLPLLFMGQEWGSETPFFFFTNFGDPALAQAVSEGRKKEYAAQGIGKEFRDPEERKTYDASKLDWAAVGESPLYRFYRKIIALRKEEPALSNCRKDLMEVEWGEQGWIRMTRRSPDGRGGLELVANLSEQILEIPYQGGEIVLETAKCNEGLPSWLCRISRL